MASVGPEMQFPQHEHERSDPARLVADPDISVTIVTYNHERYLAQALDSVLEQRTDYSFEIVIAEDCSTDATREIAFDYQRRYPQIVRVLHSDANVGMGANVMRGLGGCRGRYIAGLDGDDFWCDPGKLQAQVDALEARPDISVVFSRGFKLMPDGSHESGWNYGDVDRIVPPGELLRTPGMTVPTGSLVYRADVLLGSPEWIYRAPVMDLFHLLAAAYPNGAYYLARETAAYRVFSQGSWSGQQEADARSKRVRHFKAMMHSYDLAQESFGIPPEDFRLGRSLVNYVLGRDALLSGKPGTAIRYFSKVGLRYVGIRLAELPRRLFGR